MTLPGVLLIQNVRFLTKAGNFLVNCFSETLKELHCYVHCSSLPFATKIAHSRSMEISYCQSLIESLSSLEHIQFQASVVPDVDHPICTTEAAPE
jgi:hypothetical protein